MIEQTWSVFSNVNAQAASVNRVGSPGSISVRTPQIRYSFKIPWRELRATAALEYSLPEEPNNDSISYNTSYVQSMPNITARLNSKEKYGNLQLSGILAPITGLDSIGNKSLFLGFGVSFSGYAYTKDKNRILFQATYGSAVSHFINMFRNKELDLVYNPTSHGFQPVNSLSGNVAYEYHWKQNLSSNLSFGIADIQNTSIQPPGDYNYSYSASFNTFWTIVEGARIGLEYMYGERFNVDNSRGTASRLWALLYYDF